VLRDDAVWSELRDAIEQLVEPEVPSFGSPGGSDSSTRDSMVFGKGGWIGSRPGGSYEVEMLAAGVFLVQNKKVARVELYASRDEALEAAGVSRKDRRRAS